MKNESQHTEGPAPDKKETGERPLSETIPNAHGSGDGSIRMAEDGMIDTGETIADADANKEPGSIKDEY
jgi:hypothetical protein